MAPAPSPSPRLSRNASHEIANWWYVKSERMKEQSSFQKWEKSQIAAKQFSNLKPAYWEHEQNRDATSAMHEKYLTPFFYIPTNLREMSSSDQL